MNDFYRTSIPDEDVPPEQPDTLMPKAEAEEVTIKQLPVAIQPQPIRQSRGVKMRSIFLGIICGLALALIVTLLVVL